MKKFVLVIVGIAAVAVIVAFYMGAFQRIAITEEDRGPYTLVYRDMAAGRMSDVGAITTALDTMLESRGISARKPLDVFFPDGRGQIGFSVEGVSGDQLGALVRRRERQGHRRATLPGDAIPVAQSAVVHGRIHEGRSGACAIPRRARLQEGRSDRAERRRYDRVHAARSLRL